MANSIDRNDAAGLLATQDIFQIIEDATYSSAALQTFRRVNMGTKQARMPVLTALPSADWVSETTSKPTAEMKWADLNLTAEEMAVVVPIHENVLDDSEVGIWDEVRPRVAEEFGALLDSRVFFGASNQAPSSWPAGIVPATYANGQVYSRQYNTGDLGEDINQTWAIVEDKGYDVNVQYTARYLRAALRGLRDDQGQPIYLSGLRADGRADQIYGEDLFYVRNGSWVAAQDPDNTQDSGDEVGADLVVGDRSNAILGIRSDMEVKMLTEATVGSGSGSPINLAERDMVALRFKMRVAFQVAQPLQVETGQQEYPFASLIA